MTSSPSFAILRHASRSSEASCTASPDCASKSSSSSARAAPPSSASLALAAAGPASCRSSAATLASASCSSRSFSCNTSAASTWASDSVAREGLDGATAASSGRCADNRPLNSSISTPPASKSFIVAASFAKASAQCPSKRAISCRVSASNFFISSICRDMFLHLRLASCISRADSASAPDICTSLCASAAWSSATCLSASSAACAASGL
mmetsp:Transcript_98980/g.317402  ORF Transcript_98980/g.317402 Transcript_98980/m.317402 type:complete len:210 (-) Transcript_98980:2169-2798(-)